MTSYTRGTDTSNALTEVRTVLSRAETALAALDRERAREGDPLSDWLIGTHWDSGDGLFHADQDIEDMIDALSETVRRLDKYRRIGKSKRR